jgi:hypothetical protein
LKGTNVKVKWDGTGMPYDGEMGIPVMPWCESCWIKRYGEWDWDGGRFVLVSTPIPHRAEFLHSPLDKCAVCGSDTVSGIYEHTHAS